MATNVEGVGAKRAKGQIRGRQQGEINRALDMATDMEHVGTKRPGNVRTKSLSESKEGGRNKKINRALDVATVVEIVGAMRPVMSKGTNKWGP